jgi:hypothetical protein
MFYDGLSHILNLDYVRMVTLDVQAWPALPQGSGQVTAYFEQFTYNSINGPGIDASTDTQYMVDGKLDIRVKMLQYKEKMMRGSFDVYKMFTRPAFTTSLIVWIALIAMSVRSGKWRALNGGFLIVSSWVLGLLFSRLMTLAIVDATTSVGGIFYYNASNYIFVYIFVFTMLYWALDQVIRLIRSNTGRQVENMGNLSHAELLKE